MAYTRKMDIFELEYPNVHRTLMETNRLESQFVI